MFWPPTDSYSYDEPFRLRHEERLRHVVFLDGRLIDSWASPVEGTRYRELAEEYDREKQLRHYRPEPMPALHERVLTWLDGVVGGRRALLALDDEPLLSSTGAMTDDAIDALLRQVADELFDAEFHLAARAVLASVHESDAALVADTPGVEVAAGICWLVGRANGLVGAGTPVTQKVLKRALWLSTSPSRRTPRIKACLRGLRPEPGPRPASCPDLLELGDPAVLTSPTRRRLITLRDRALEVAEEVEADRHARAALTPEGVASLTT